jgi:hypothetical protein
MNKPSYRKILEHPDKDEIIAKLVIGQPPTDIHDWLKIKYTNVNEKKFVLTENILKSFQTNHLNFYNDILQDIQKTKIAVTTNTTDALDLAVKNNPIYEDAMVKLATGELNVDQMMAKMAINVETRISQIFDAIQADPNNINTKIDRLLVDYAEMFGNVLDKYYKWKENQANQTIHANVTLQVVDQHISVFHDVIKEVLSQMDLETSLYFMEVFNNKMTKLKIPDFGTVSTPEMKLAEAKILNETINKKINENDQI